LWVAGLVAMSGYLAWRPGPAAERAALDALRAAVQALGDRPCAHESHPYEKEMDSLEEEIWAGETRLVRELPAQEGDTGPEPVRCPGNVAGWARLALDLIAPLTVRRIPAGAPKYHRSCIRSLSGIVNDYPYDDPHDVLTDEAACLPSRPTPECWPATS
ncbi:hypothetical protein ACWGIP_26685, partial [Streptomyces sp. NPDC054838]